MIERVSEVEAEEWAEQLAFFPLGPHRTSVEDVILGLLSERRAHAAEIAEARRAALRDALGAMKAFRADKNIGRRFGSCGEWESMRVWLETNATQAGVEGKE